MKMSPRTNEAKVVDDEDLISCVPRSTCYHLLLYAAAAAVSSPFSQKCRTCDFTPFCASRNMDCSFHAGLVLQNRPSSKFLPTKNEEDFALLQAS
jgi:hypothetical protein